MIEVAFPKKTDANPYYFDGTPLGDALELTRQLDALVASGSLRAGYSLAGGHRNPTGYDALVRIRPQDDAAVAAVQAFLQPWAHRCRIETIAENAI